MATNKTINDGSALSNPNEVAEKTESPTQAIASSALAGQMGAYTPLIAAALSIAAGILTVITLFGILPSIL